MRRPGRVNLWKLLLGSTLAALIIGSMTVGALRARSGDTVADRELGQPDFFHDTANIPESDVMNGPVLIAIDKSVTPNRLYVADQSNNRVLGYKSVNALMSGQFADLVIGQPDAYSSACDNGGRSATSLCAPAGIAVDNAGNLFVTDTDNHRVLEYNQPFASGRTANQPANWVLGQGGDFTSSGCNLGANSFPNAETLCFPVGVALDGAGNLYVADAGNNRVLEYNAPFITAFAANRVFGQFGNFTINAANDNGANKSGAPSAGNLSNPAGISVDAAGNLYVADLNNNRGLKFNTPLMVNGGARQRRHYRGPGVRTVRQLHYQQRQRWRA